MDYSIHFDDSLRLDYLLLDNVINKLNDRSISI